MQAFNTSVETPPEGRNACEGPLRARGRCSGGEAGRVKTSHGTSQRCNGRTDGRVGHAGGGCSTPSFRKEKQDTPSVHCGETEQPGADGTDPDGAEKGERLEKAESALE